jgi:AhpD family alkylhydroperoxidase
VQSTGARGGIASLIGIGATKPLCSSQRIGDECKNLINMRNSSGKRSRVCFKQEKIAASALHAAAAEHACTRGQARTASGEMEASWSALAEK